MQQDLSLVPIDSLIKEIFNRTNCCVIGYIRDVDSGPPIVLLDWNANGSYVQAVGLCEEIKLTIQIHARQNLRKSEDS